MKLLLCTLCIRCISVYDPINVITVTCTSDTGFANDTFFAPLTGLVLTVDRAWETSHIYLTTIWNINGVVQFVNTNNKCNVYVDRNNASNIRFTKSLNYNNFKL